MQVGVMMFPTDKAIPPDELAREVESRGFATLWFPEHTHIPVDHSPYPAGGELPEMYFRTLDPFVALGAAAAVTTDLRIGTGVCLVAQRDPITLAKEVASVDHLSGGRFVFGIGYGWNVPELEHHGPEFDQRRARLRENVLAMKQLWTEEQASYSGEYVEFGPSFAWPKPIQTPNPPIYMGAALGPKTIAHIVEFCDGWMPIRGGSLEDSVAALRSAAEEAGRDPDSIDIAVYGSSPDPDKVAFYARAGASSVNFWLPAAPRDEVLPVLDELAKLREQVAG